MQQLRQPPNPKEAKFKALRRTVRSPKTKTFEDLRSWCTYPQACMCDTPAQMPWAQLAIMYSGTPFSVPIFLTSLYMSELPCSITITWSTLSCPRSSTMFGCFPIACVGQHRFTAAT